MTSGTQIMKDGSNISTFHYKELPTDCTRSILEDSTLKDVLFPNHIDFVLTKSRISRGPLFLGLRGHIQSFLLDIK